MTFDEFKSEHPAAETFDIYIPNPEGMGMPAWFHLAAHVNATEFEGRPAGTVLFFGGHANSADPYQKLRFLYLAEGWNTGDEPPFASADLAILVVNRVDVTKGFGRDFEPQHARKPGWAPQETWLPPSEFDCPAIGIALGWHEEGSHPRTLAVRVTNLGDDPLPSFGVAIFYNYETPQPGDLGGIPYQALSGGLYLEKEYLFDRTLRPGTSTTFAVPHFMIDSLLSMAASLSPERFRLVAGSDKTELAVLDGAALGAFLDGHESDD